MPTDKESYETTNQEMTNRGKVAHQYDPGKHKPPTYSTESGTIGESTSLRLDEQQAVKSNQQGDGTGSGGTDD